jgi:hypothetical protein
MKRITLYLPDSIEIIKKRLEADCGIKMTYVQVFSFLMNFYLKHANEPRTKWSPLQ